MSNLKPVPPFVFDSLYYLNRDQLERFTIVCRSLKNFIERYFHSQPHRFFDFLWIRRGSYALVHNEVDWHPNRDGYSAQQFLAGQRCTDNPYYSFAEMRPYLGPTVRINWTTIDVAGDNIYNPEHIEEMESIVYLWRHSNISIKKYGSRIVAENFQPILNSPTILQCRELHIAHADFPFKNYKVLYTVKVIESVYTNNFEIDLNYWPQFLEQSGVKPIVVLKTIRSQNIANVLHRLKEAFISAVSPNDFKIVFVLHHVPLTEFRETNKISGEKLELKRGIPTEYQFSEFFNQFNYYTLERSTI